MITVWLGDHSDDGRCCRFGSTSRGKKTNQVGGDSTWQGSYLLFRRLRVRGRARLSSELRKQVKGVDFSISWTTRPPRGSEENGREYCFTTREDFDRHDRGRQVPGACRGLWELLRNRCASRWKTHRRKGTIFFSTSMSRGRTQVRADMPEAVSIFVLPPTPKVLRTRLRNRSRAEGLVNESEFTGGLSEAAKEIENYRNYSYILINDILDRAVAQLEAIVLAERYYRNAEPIAFRSSRVLEVASRMPAIELTGTVETGARGFWN